MDSQQLITALTDAQQQAGGHPITIKTRSVTWSARSGPRGLRVRYDPGPPTGRSGEQEKPTIYLEIVS